MVGFDGKTAEDVIRAEFLEEFKELHKDIWYRLIQLVHTIITLEKMQKFPFQHFYDSEEMTFWDTVYWNFVHMATILLHGLAGDQGGDAHTLQKFSNKVIEGEWINCKELERKYREALKCAKFDEDASRIGDIIKELRNKVVAHRLLDSSTERPFENVQGVKISELRERFNALKRMFEVCCFDCENSTTTVDYGQSTVGGIPQQSGLENLLDLIAKDSNFVNMPERDPPRWELRKKRLSQEEILVMNIFRRKFELPEV